MKRFVWRVTWAVVLGLGWEGRAHWCHDLFGTSYNLVVRPASDTVQVPPSGTATLDVWAQNNTGYGLKNFAMTAAASGYTVSIARQAPRMAGYLMPGESLRHTLTISRAGGATLAAESISFYVTMGDGQQSICYGRSSCDFSGANGTQTKAVALRKTDGTVPNSPVPLTALPGGAWDQARHLRFASQADFGDVNQGLDNLMGLYCAGRASWDPTNENVMTACCPSSTQTVCPLQSGSTGCSGSRTWSTVGGNFNNLRDMVKLWSAGELGARKSGLGAARLAALRERLRCSWSDPNLPTRGFAAFVLGYLGEDAAARTLLQGVISSGTAAANDKLVAKAALLLMRNAQDAALYRADVTAGLTSSNLHVSYLCAASLGIVDRNDAVVASNLLPRASQWIGPGEPTFDDAASWYASNLLSLVAWDRRGWAPNGGDTGVVSFYGTGPQDTTPPQPPGQIACVANAQGTVRVTWNAVTRDVAGNPETVSGYRVYWGNQGRPGGVTRPGQGFDYAHVDDTAGVYMDFPRPSSPALDGTRTYHFTVLARDSALNESVYAAEVSCVPAFPPTARLTCTPTSGTAPLSVTCDGNASTDPNGAADLASYSFSLDGQAAQSQNPVSYTLAAGSHVVRLTVADRAGATSSDQLTVSVASPSGNRPPVAQAAASPTSGPMPLSVQFSSAGSSDPDQGQVLSYSWNFADGSSAQTQANPTHVFSAAGDYAVVLAVTDDQTPALTSYATVTVRVSGNRAPDVSAATVSPLSGPAPLLVQLDGSGVLDPEGNAVSFAWNPGDGSAPLTQRVATHRFQTPGTFTVTLSAQDDGLPQVPPATKTFTVEVSPPLVGNRAPDCAAATVTPTEGTAELAVRLDASGCLDPDGDSLSYLWRVSTSLSTEERLEAATGEHLFSRPGSYSVFLTVRDDAPSPMEVNREFLVTVQAGAPAGIAGSCGCGSGVGASGTCLGLLLAFLRRRRSAPR